MPDPNSLMDNLDGDKNLVKFTDSQIAFDLSFTKQMKFDNHKRYLICVGDTKIFVFDIKKQRGSFYEVPETIIERILDVKLTSSMEKGTQNFKSIKCMVACKRIGFK